GGDLEDRGGGAVRSGARRVGGEGGVLVGADRLGAGHRRVVDGVDGDGDGGRRRRVDDAVVGLEVEGVGAVEVGVGRVGDVVAGVGDGVGAAGQVPGHDLVATGAGAVIELAAGGQGGDLEDRGGGAV